MLSEEYRPTDFADYVGQDEVVAKIRTAIDRNVRKGKPVVLWIHGESGTGKTTLAGILARYVGCADIGIDDRNGGHIGAAEVIDFCRTVRLSPLQGEWKATIVEESHLMTQTAVGDLLDPLEKSLPSKRLVIFTSTRDIEDGELFREHNVPFRRRCLCFKLQPVAGQPAIARILDIAKREDIPLDGPAAERLLSACRGNFGEALSRLEAGNIPPAVVETDKPKSRFDSIKFAA